MKLAVSGKGGVGKTTVAAGLARFFAANGFSVYAVDADPDLSLGTVLGIPEEVVEGLTPIVDLREEIANSTGGEGAFVSLNPDVDGLIKNHTYRLGNIRFLKMGAVKQAGSSCYCRENSVLGAVLRRLMFAADDMVILDMGAGIEHLTRGTAAGVDLMLVVTEPSRTSVKTARVVQKLAGELGIEQVAFIGNRVRLPQEEEFLRSSFTEEELVYLLPFDDQVMEQARSTGDQALALQSHLDRLAGILAARLGRTVPGPVIL